MGNKVFKISIVLPRHVSLHVFHQPEVSGVNSILFRKILNPHAQDQAYQMGILISER